MPAEVSVRRGNVLVLICSDLSAAGLNPSGLVTILCENSPAVSAHCLPGLCSDPSLIEAEVARTRPVALVLGLCRTWSLTGETEEHARRGGLNPLALQVAALASISGTAASPMDHAERLLGSMVARAAVFPGARPDNVKPVRRRMSKRSRRNLFVLPPVTYQPVPTFTRGLCRASDGCELCAKACPVEALDVKGRQIELNREVCSGCGLCISACPQRAVEMPGWSPVEIERQLDVVLSQDPAPPVAFVCSTGPLPGAPWVPVRLRCTAGLPVAAILGTLARGAPRVAIQPCNGACGFANGDALGTTVRYCQSLLALFGGSSGRVAILDASWAPSFEGELRPPAASSSPDGPPRVFGAGADGAAVLALARLLGARSGRILERDSPLGLISVDPGACTTCGTCASACHTGALTYRSTGSEAYLNFEHGRCTACAACLPVCPEQERKAISLERVVDLHELEGGRRELARDRLAACRRCGGPVAAPALLERVAALLGEDYQPRYMAELCPGCRQGY